MMKIAREANRYRPDRAERCSGSSQRHCRSGVTLFLDPAYLVASPKMRQRCFAPGRLELKKRCSEKYFRAVRVFRGRKKTESGNSFLQGEDHEAFERVDSVRDNLFTPTNKAARLDFH